MKIKTWNNSDSVGRGWTTWYEDSQHYYASGVSYMKNCIIEMFHQPETDDYRPYATARIVHNGKLLGISTQQNVTKMGWVRIARKWARKIKSQA